MKHAIITFCTIILLITFSPFSSLAMDGFGVSTGETSGEDINFFRADFQFSTDYVWFKEGDWFLGLCYDLGVMYMKSHAAITPLSRAADDLFGVSLTPMFRLQRVPFSTGMTPFIEAGVGATLLSERTLQTDEPEGLELGNYFQFEIALSTGLRFGQRQQFELSADFRHYSNLVLWEHNDGIDIAAISFSFWF